MKKIKAKDGKKFLEKNTKIESKTGEIIPFELTKDQDELLSIIEKNNRVMIKKDRQIGSTTAVVGSFYHNTISNEGIVTVLVAPDIKSVQSLLNKVKLFHETTKEKLRPELLYEKYGNGEHRIRFPELNSGILILNISKPPVGYAIQNVFILCGGCCKNEELSMMMIEGSVPITGKIVIDNSFSSDRSIFNRMWEDTNNGYFKKDYTK